MKEFWDNHAGGFITKHPLKTQYPQVEYDLLDGVIESYKPNSILDICCGCGLWYEHLQKYKFIKNYLGIDISSKMLDEFVARFPNANIICEDFGDFISKPLETKYDLGLSITAFQHISPYKFNIIKTHLHKYVNTLFICDQFSPQLIQLNACTWSREYVVELEKYKLVFSHNPNIAGLRILYFELGVG